MHQKDLAEISLSWTETSKLWQITPNFITFISIFISGHIDHNPRRISIIWFKALIFYFRMEGYCQKAVNYKFRILKKVFGNLLWIYLYLLVLRRCWPLRVVVANYSCVKKNNFRQNGLLRWSHKKEPDFYLDFLILFVEDLSDWFNDASQRLNNHITFHSLHSGSTI